MTITAEDKAQYIASLKRSASGKRAYAKSRRCYSPKVYKKDAEMLEWTCEVLLKDEGLLLGESNVKKLVQELISDLIFKYNIKIDSFDRDVLEEAFQNKINEFMNKT